MAGTTKQMIRDKLKLKLYLIRNTHTQIIIYCKCPIEKQPTNYTAEGDYLMIAIITCIFCVGISIESTVICERFAVVHWSQLGFVIITI